MPWLVKFKREGENFTQEYTTNEEVLEAIAKAKKAGYSTKHFPKKELLNATVTKNSSQK